MDQDVEKLVKAAEREWLEGWKEGPKRLRWTEPPLQVGDPAPHLHLLDTAGNSVRLSTLWHQQPLLVIFWRHYGCGCGVQRANRLAKEHLHYLAAGAQVVAIGQGEPSRSAAYAQKYNLVCPILSDPTHRAYDSFGLLEGTPAQILYDAPDEFLRHELDAGIRLMEARRGAGRPMVDSPWLLPGEFVIDIDGKVALAHRYNHCEDWPDPRVLIAAIRAAGGKLD